MQEIESYGKLPLGTFEPVRCCLGFLVDAVDVS